MAQNIIKFFYLTFPTNCELVRYICSLVTRMLGFNIYNMKVFHDPGSFKIVLTNYVRSKFEYSKALHLQLLASLFCCKHIKRTHKKITMTNSSVRPDNGWYGIHDASLTPWTSFILQWGVSWIPHTTLLIAFPSKGLSNVTGNLILWKHIFLASLHWRLLDR